MALVIKVTDDNGIPQGIGQGIIVTEGITGVSTVGIRGLVAPEMNPLKPAGYLALYIAWNLSIWVPTITAKIQGFKGSPNKYGLGQVSFNSVGCVGRFEFWNYQWQAFRTQGCIGNQGVIGYAKTQAEVPATINVNLLIAASKLTNNLGFGIIPSFPKDDTGLAGNTGYSVYPEDNGMPYNTCISYIAQWGTSNPNGTLPISIYNG